MLVEVIAHLRDNTQRLINFQLGKQIYPQHQGMAPSSEDYFIVSQKQGCPSLEGDGVKEKSFGGAHPLKDEDFDALTLALQDDEDSGEIEVVVSDGSRTISGMDSK
eukprot:UC4_evm1s869